MFMNLLNLVVSDFTISLVCGSTRTFEFETSCTRAIDYTVCRPRTCVSGPRRGAWVIQNTGSDAGASHFLDGFHLSDSTVEVLRCCESEMFVMKRAILSPNPLRPRSGLGIWIGIVGDWGVGLM